jgi:protein-tyrosine phosphatase
VPADDTAAPAGLPDPRRPGRYRLALVCLGNICRSPMAHVVLEARLAEAGLADRVEVLSSGTASWHEGKPMDRRAAATLTSHGYDASRHRARQFPAAWHDECDLVLAMDAANHADLTDAAQDRGTPAEPARLRLFRDFDPRATAEDRDVPDPYYGDDDGFEHVLRIIGRTSAELVRRLRAAVDG